MGVQSHLTHIYSDYVLVWELGGLYAWGSKLHILGFQTCLDGQWDSKTHSLGQRKSFIQTCSRMGCQHQERAQLEFGGFALLVNPSEHVLESWEDEAVKLKELGAFSLLSAGAWKQKAVWPSTAALQWWTCDTQASMSLKQGRGACPRSGAERRESPKQERRN